MLRFFSLAVLCASLIAGCSSRSSSDQASGGKVGVLSAGQNAPDREMKEITGAGYTLASQRGKPIFIDFWATWCPPCRISIPEVKKLHAEYGPRGVEVVGISLDDRIDSVQQFVQDAELKHRQIFSGDSGIDKAYGIRGIPMFVAIDKEGRISKIWTGFSPGMAEEWRSELERLLKA